MKTKEIERLIEQAYDEESECLRRQYFPEKKSWGVWHFAAIMFLSAAGWGIILLIAKVTGC